MEQTFYLGVVEDRDDPMKLGRCRIRVIGVHTPDKVELPTDDLPWATPVQPITSAAMSGIGTAPVGPVPGTWCLVIFTDPESKQQPMFLGTIGGIPISPGIYNNDSENITGNDADGYKLAQPATIEQPTAVDLGKGMERPAPVDGGMGLGTLTKPQYEAMRAAIRFKESSNIPTKVNNLGYIGWYQFGIAMLEDMGYVKKGTWAKYKKNSVTADPDVWSGKNGITSRDAFMASTTEQDKAFEQSMKIWYSRMKRAGYAGPDTPPERLAGLMCVAHLKGTGAGGVKDFLIGRGTPDAYGTTPGKYYEMGYNAVAKANGKPTGIPPVPSLSSDSDLVNPDKQPEDLAQVNGVSYDVSAQATLKGDPSTVGFIDPNLKYPLTDHINEPDTPRLARSEKISQTIVAEKSVSRTLNVSLANTDAVWSQPTVPYNAKYPYNHVTVTESGHVIELDDTPGAERIHIYHSSGTFVEIDNEGNKVDKTKGSKFTMTSGDDVVLVDGTGGLTINGDYSVEIFKTKHIEVHGNIELHCHSDVHYKIDGDFNIDCKNFNVHSNASTKVVADGDTSFRTTNYHIKASATFNTEAESAINMLTQGGFNSQSSGAFSINAGGNFAVDGSKIYIQSGKSGSASSATIAAQPLPAAAGWASEASFILPPWSPTIHVPVVHDWQSAEGVMMEADDDGNPVPGTRSDYPYGSEIDPSIASSESEPVGFDYSSPLDGATIKAFPIEIPITGKTRLSPNYTIKDLCNSDSAPNPNNLGAYGLSSLDMARNLQIIAIHVLEPARAKFPNLNINSGVRKPNNPYSQKLPKVSRHELALAVDLGLTGGIKGMSKKQAMLVLAKYIQNLNSPHIHKIILEYTTNGSVWVHVQVNGNVGPKAAANAPTGSNFILTMENHKTKASGKFVI